MAASCSQGEKVRGFEPLRAWVAVLPQGESVAQVGEINLPADTPFDLYAVLEAERDGDTVYFSQATALSFDGEPVDPAALQSWPARRHARVRWFSIEGAPPFLDWSEEGRFPGFLTAFRSEWGSGWTIPGDIRPSNPHLAYGAAVFGPNAFGTLRYHIRVETYARETDFAPSGRYVSPGVGEDGILEAGLTAVRLQLEPPLGAASLVFGVGQVEEIPAENLEVLSQFRLNAAAGRMFSRAYVLARTLAEAETQWPDLNWSSVDLAAIPGEVTYWRAASGEGANNGEGTSEDRRQTAAFGDLLRVGDRVVFAFRDDTPEGNGNGVLDYNDWCLDFSRGAAVRRFSDVFTGGGWVEWAPLSVAPSDRGDAG